MPSNNPELRKQIEGMGLNFDVLELVPVITRVLSFRSLVLTVKLK